MNGDRARRGSWTAKAASITLSPGQLGGEAVLFAVSDAEPHRALVLRRDEGGTWRCRCFAALHSLARDCDHARAAREAA